MKYTLQYAQTVNRDMRSKRVNWVDVDTFDTFEAAHAASGRLPITSDNGAVDTGDGVVMLGARDRIVEEV